MNNKNNIPTIAALAEIYDRHAGIMYGCIFRLVEKQDTSEKILKQIFSDLYNKEQKKVLNINDRLWFAKLALQTTVAFLKDAAVLEGIKFNERSLLASTEV